MLSLLYKLYKLFKNYEIIEIFFEGIKNKLYIYIYYE